MSCGGYGADSRTYHKIYRQVETMVSTVQAIFLTQVPIAVGILIGAYLLNDVKQELVRILEHLTDNHTKTKK